MTALTKVIIGGFKSIRKRTEIPIAPLTFFFGPNSAGKSAVAAAIEALVERIEEPPHPTYLNFGPGAPPVFKDQLVHLFPTNLAPNAGLRAMDVTLGAEIEDFPALGPDLGADLSEGQQLGKVLFWALDGASVGLEINEFYGDQAGDGVRLTTCIVSVDRRALFTFVNRDFDANNLPVKVVSSQSKKMEMSEIWRPLGKISINTQHPIWSVYDIQDSGGNISRMVPDANSNDSCVSRQYLSYLVQGLRDFATEVRSPFLKQLIRLDGDLLNINTSVGFFDVMPLSPSALAVTNYQSISFAALWKKIGARFPAAMHVEHGEFIDRINTLLIAISYACKCVLEVMPSYLQLEKVEGDRKILNAKDVNVKLPLMFSSFMTDGKWGETGEGMYPRRHWRTGQKRGGTTPIQQYAFWLGLKNAQTLHWGEYTDSIVNRNDFVNEILSKGLFGGRSYQVKPETWHIKTECVSMRHVESYYEQRADQDVLDIHLYLEDEQGRRIDFSEVGSGISYVFPILTSLAVARTSWIAQPELHLHPSAQCELGDVFLRAFNHGHYSVVETHSEHLLLRVLKRIRQTTNQVDIDGDLKCPAEAVCVLYFAPQEDGSTEVRQLRVTRLGDFKDRWPDGFFEERGKELFDE